MEPHDARVSVDGSSASRTSELLELTAIARAHKGILQLLATMIAKSWVETRGADAGRMGGDSVSVSPPTAESPTLSG